MKLSLERLYRRYSITLDYLLSMFILLTVVLVGISLYHTATLRSAQQAALENVRMLSNILFENVEGNLESLDTIATAIAYSDRVNTFLTEDNMARRYDRDVNVYSFITGLMEQNPSVRTVVLYDDCGALYQYGFQYTHETCRSLYRQFGATDTASFTVARAEGNDYFMLCMPVYSTRLGRMERLGIALLFAPSRLVSGYLDAYGMENGMTFLLTDSRNTILSASDETLRGQALSQSLLVSSTKIIDSQPLSMFGLMATVAQDDTLLAPYTNAFITMMLMLMAGLSFVFILLSLAFRKYLLHPIDQVISAIDSIGDGHPEERVPLTANRKVNQMAEDLNHLLDSLSRSNAEAMEKQRALYDAQLSRRKHQLYMLRKQIDVHFTYNTLSTIASLAQERKQNDIRRMAEGLSVLQRSNFMTNEYVNVFAEFQMLEEYVYIMNVRYASRFHVHYDVDDCLCRVRMLRQLLQPLVENAMLHAREQDDQPIRIWLRCSLQDKQVRLSISDDGQGIPPERLRDLRARVASAGAKVDSEDDLGKSHNISLVNISRRLRMFYGEAASLDIDSRVDAGTQVTLLFPCEEDAQKSDDRSCSS